MFNLFLVVAIFESYCVSLPITNVIDPRQQLQSCPVPNHKMRTRSDIVWGCVSTLFICTWVAIHPNIPPRDGVIRSLWRRVKLMMWTLLVPELILMWAYKQWAAARHIAEYFRDEDWTPMHGHFLIMGGFVFIDGERELVLDFDGFRGLLGLVEGWERKIFEGQPLCDHHKEPTGHFPDARISFPMITAEELCDKTRGDFLSKAIVILQSLWFIVQCIARGKEGFALTELELVTLALASLTGIMYFFWWDKPLGVKEPIKIYREGQEPPKRVVEGGESENQRREQHIKDSKRSLVQKLFVWPFQQMQSSLQLLEDSRASLSSYFSSISSSSLRQFLEDQLNKLDKRIPAVNFLWPLYLPLYWFIWIPSKSLVDALSAIAHADWFESDTPRVPTFYAPQLSGSIDPHKLLFLVLAPITIIFGALHCIAWNFHFPSYIEQLLWRIGSLAITLISSLPPLAMATIELQKLLEKRYNLSLPIMPLPRTVKVLLGLILRFFRGVGIVTYILARLLLITQAIILLRKQPDSAFYAIDWLNFLPHI